MEDFKYEWDAFPEFNPTQEEVIDLTQPEEMLISPLVPEQWEEDIKQVEEKVQGEDGEENRVGDEQGRSACADWFFTFNNPVHPGDFEDFKKLLDLHCKAYGFQYEVGKKGTKHYQGQVSFLKKTRKPSLVFGKYKMWWERTRHLGKARNYTANKKKEGFLDGPWVLGQTQASGKRSAFDDARDAATKEEAIAILWEKQSRAMFIYGDKIEQNVAKRFKKDDLKEFDPYENSTFINIPVGMTSWVNDNIGIKKRRYPILVVEGKSQLGKTEWARSLGPHVYWKGETNAKDLINDTDAQFLIIDDIAFSDLPKGFPKSVCLGSGKMVVTDKYLPKSTIIWNKPCIFLCNNQGNMPWYMDEYWQENATVVKVSQRLY